MPKLTEAVWNSFIYPLYANRLQGRLMYWPSSKKSKTEILVVYNLNDSIESLFEFIKQLSHFGSVTCVDLPGIGGMESFNNINVRPNLEAFADYVASLVKLRFRGKRLIIVGIGYGFVISTRMLQNYPEISRRTDLVVSVGGYTRYDDLNISKGKRYAGRVLTLFASLLLPSALLKLMVTNNAFVKNKSIVSPSERKYLNSLTEAERKLYFYRELKVWKSRGLRTYMASLYEVTKLDNCKKTLSVPVWQVFLNSSRYNNHIIEQHLKVIYKNFRSSKVSFDEYTLFAMDQKDASKVLPVKLKRLLSKIIK